MEVYKTNVLCYNVIIELGGYLWQKRKNGEGTWGTKIIKGETFKFYRDANGKYTYGKTDTIIKKKLSEK